MLFLPYVNVSRMLPRSRLSSQPLTLPAPWVLLHVRWSIPPGYMVPSWVTASRFLAGNTDAELKPTTFSSTFPCFSVFPLLLNPPSDIVPLIAACWGSSLIIIIYIYSKINLGRNHLRDQDRGQSQDRDQSQGRDQNQDLDRNQIHRHVQDHDRHQGQGYVVRWGGGVRV